MLNNYLSLDVGRARIGVAIANDIARIAAPQPAIPNDAQCIDVIANLVREHSVSRVVVGWPRGLDGQETEQTRYVGEFTKLLEEKLSVPVVMQDEAVTSVKAETELKQRGGAYEKGDIDSLSAVYILEDFLQEGVH